MDRDPDVAAVLITNPTPYGTCADLASIVALCHSHGKPLLVDETWGARLPCHSCARWRVEQITPYPPGIPALLPGECLGQEALDYLITGVRAGMVLPDPVDPRLEHIRVVA